MVRDIVQSVTNKYVQKRFVEPDLGAVHHSRHNSGREVRKD